MERLVNDLMKLGARRQDLEVKLVGGGRVLEAATDVGAANIAFVRAYVRAEGFAVAGEDLGDAFPRKVHYYPRLGRVRVRKLQTVRNDTIRERERRYLATLDTLAPQGGGVELF
jgi:chemotaxis protein CheD